MENFGSPNGYGGDRRVEFNGINQETAVDQMYVARSRGQPPSRRIVCMKKRKSSSNNSASLIFSVKSWYNNSEQKRKRRMTKYKIYAMEGCALSPELIKLVIWPNEALFDRIGSIRCTQ
ncbi:uncharacterized protein LOC130818450 [Amaranthus tricolor]|uniref:uncharacterized protein LOC130818450 n=1 Tax=Amaranthus tricolor TaxID=29722 RepID=UPI00258EA9C5|nr:uncharacterized protein LOC130818450 [Amaranthus tricolor]